METFSLIKLIMGVVFVGVMILTGMNNKEPTYMVVLAVLITFGILYGIGQLPYSFFIFIVLGLMMHTYVKTGSIEDTLFNVLLVVTVCIILGMFGDADFFKPFREFKLKEGFWLNPNRQYDHISHSMTAMQCQNACQQKPNCKFAVFPYEVERGARGHCWNTKGKDSGQKLRGSKPKSRYGNYAGGGYSAWRNKYYEPKKPLMLPHYLRWYGRWPHCNNISCGRGTLKEFKEKCSEKPNCDGFSWTKGRNSNSSRGSGCLKYNCKPAQEGRNGFGRGSHGYWLKGHGSLQQEFPRHGMYIAIKNNAANRWIAAEPNGRIGHRAHRITWETFQVLRHPDGRNWLLKSYHGAYLQFLPYGTTNSDGVRPIRHYPHFSVVFSAKGRRPTAGWSWERIQFVKSGSNWSIYNPYHRRYMSGYTNQKALGMPWTRGHEKFTIYEVVRGNWGRGSREWNDKIIR